MSEAKYIVGVYIRLPLSEVQRLREHPDVLPKYDPRVALNDGRGLDIGRAWEELAVFLDGGIRIPDQGPSVGDEPIHCRDTRAAWSCVLPERVVEFAESLSRFSKRDFTRLYELDSEDTAPSLPGTRTAGWGDRETYLFGKLRALAKHYREAADRGEAILVRIGERV